MKSTKLYRSCKHSLDILVALLLLVPVLPVLLLLFIAIRLDSRGPALYQQKRIGRFGRTFTIYKLRSMKIDTPVLSTEEMHQSQLSPFTRLGPFLRKSNLDELPQIFNILKGEMSFVGPRPALPTQTDVNTLRHQMGVEMARPGITGLAQVKGRDDLDTQTKVDFDASYCRGISFKMDVLIMLSTVKAVVTARGNK